MEKLGMSLKIAGNSNNTQPQIKLIRDGNNQSFPGSKTGLNNTMLITTRLYRTRARAGYLR